MDRYYEIHKLVGGGTSWNYLLSPEGRIVMASHEDDKQRMEFMLNVLEMLNTTLTGEPCVMA